MRRKNKTKLNKTKNKKQKPDKHERANDRNREGQREMAESHPHLRCELVKNRKWWQWEPIPHKSTKLAEKDQLVCSAQ